MTLQFEGDTELFDIRTLDGYTLAYRLETSRPWYVDVNESTFLPLFPDRAALDATMKAAGISEHEYIAKRIIDPEGLIKRLGEAGIVVCINLHADGQGAWSFDPIYRAGDLQ